MHWTSHGNGCITFMALGERWRLTPAFKAEFTHLFLPLVLNFPRLLQHHQRQNEMRIDTAPGDLPLIGVLTGAAPPQAEVVAGLESKTQPPILSSRHLYTYLQAITKPDPTILHVHPHPCVIATTTLQAGPHPCQQEKGNWSDHKVQLRRQVSLD
ncbi:hypothetical protein JG687_00015343 [Phytophthora cactorum]|uniref:Uncharacterized protein n=1 Tax=Phytophthora cactorum TaxID=29920 RepID=A0A8T1TU01_9STRA|nr:hypothetical protein JG687_00015343 [Phytophthora cactorum]